MAKNDNMLAILWMLNSGRKITAKQIAEKLEIRIRIVYRYIDSLCASGVLIMSDSGQNGGYKEKHCCSGDMWCYNRACSEWIIGFKRAYKQ